MVLQGWLSRRIREYEYMFFSTHTEIHKVPLLKAKKRTISRIPPLFLRPTVCATL